MTVTRDNILAHELVGLHAAVSESANAQLVGMSGTVVDETKSMLVLRTGSGLRSIPKDINTWTFETAAGCSFRVEGGRIARRSAGRLA